MSLARVLALAALFAVALASCPLDGSTLPASPDGGYIGSDSDYAGATPYGEDETCSWTLDCSGFPDTYVQIDYVTGETEEGYDFVNVGGHYLDGTFDDATLNVALGQPQTLTVEFTSDASENRRGFTLKYSCPVVYTQALPTTCDYNSPSHLTDPFGGFSVPDDYNPNQVCDWHIECPSGSEVTLSVAGETEDGYDFVTVGGPGLTDLQFTGTFSAPSLRFPYSPNEIFVRFESDYAVGPGGFTVSYRCTSCSAPSDGTFYNGLSGVIETDTDGSGSNFYQSNEFCTWLVQCPPNYRIRFTSIEGDTELDYDFLRIMSDDGITELARYAGTLTESDVYAPGSPSSAVVLFTSDESNEFRGLTVTYNCLDNSYCCQATIDYCNQVDLGCAQLDCSVVNGLASGDSYFQPLATACNAASAQCAVIAEACHDYYEGCV